MWQIQFPNGWYDIDQDAQAQISSAYQAGSPTVEFTTVKSHRLGLFRHYMIQFGPMQQTNLESGRTRAVRLFDIIPYVAQRAIQDDTTTTNLVTAAQLAIQDDTTASSSHLGSESQHIVEAHSPRGHHQTSRANKIARMAAKAPASLNG